MKEFLTTRKELFILLAILTIALSVSLGVFWEIHIVDSSRVLSNDSLR